MSNLGSRYVLILPGLDDYIVATSINLRILPNGSKIIFYNDKEYEITDSRLDSDGISPVLTCKEI